MRKILSTCQRTSFPLLICSLLLFAVLPSCNLYSAETFSISGFTEATFDSTLGVAVPGRITKVPVKAGDTVKKGQALLLLEQEKAWLESKRRKLLWDNKTELNAVNRQLQTLQAHLAASRLLYQTSASISLEDLENQELEEALMLIEKSRLQVAEEREQLEYKIARQLVADKTVHAPFSGKIVEVLVSSGENCDTDTPLLRIVDNGPLQFVANVELALSQQLQLGQEVALWFESGQKPLQLTGEISFISPVVDPASSLRRIKASFDNKDFAVTPGEPGTMQLEITAP